MHCISLSLNKHLKKGKCLLCFYVYIVIKSCQVLGLQHGEVRYTEEVTVNGTYPLLTTAYYTCHSGYSINGSEANYCSKSGIWIEETPNCLG